MGVALQAVRTGGWRGGALCVPLGVGVANAVVPEAELSVTKYVDGFCGAIRLLSSMVTVIVGNICSYDAMKSTFYASRILRFCMNKLVVLNCGARKETGGSAFLSTLAFTLILVQ